MIRRLFVAIALLLGALSAVLSPAAAEKRVALVIGNAAYTRTVALQNPVNDARALAAALEGLGFEVITGLDLDLDGMRRVTRDFGDLAAGADLALFYYAGHGIQLDGRNFLLPVDATVEREIDLDFAAVEADLIVRQMDRAAATKLVILDACRNNPFAPQLARSMGGTRSAALGRGLAEIDASGGSLIAFATDPGAVALDGRGENSPFTTALLQHIATPGLEVNVLMTRVRADVYGATDGRQRPWTSSSLIGEVYLAGREQAAQSAPSDTPSGASAPADGGAALEIALWNAAERGNTPADYGAYLERYPDGVFAPLARGRMAQGTAAPGAAPVVEETRDTEVAALPPPPESAPESAPGSAPQPDPASQGATPEAVEDALALGRDARREVQERLTLLGFDTRGIDGLFGGGTRSALARWQESAGLTATGYLDRESLRRLEATTDGRLAAWRAERREAAAAAAAARRAARTAPATTPEPAQSTTPSAWRAVALCRESGARGEARDASRQQAMLKAARACAARGGAPACCAEGVSVQAD